MGVGHPTDPTLATGPEAAAVEPWPIDELVHWAGLGQPSEVVRRMPWASVVVWRPDGSGPSRPLWAQAGWDKAAWETAVWGKAMCPGFASECRLLPLLAKRRPDRVVAPLAADADRGLLLLADGGPTAATIAPGDDAVSQWSDALVGYAELQQSLVGAEAELLATGCPDLRPGRDVDRLAELMAAGLVDDRPHLLERLRVVASELSPSVPPTVQHDDLTPSNVMLDGRIIDWGDAILGHPFASLLTALLPGDARRPGNPTERRSMRDAYLRSWAAALGLEPGDGETMAWLRHQADLAMRLAPIGRIATWLRADDGALVLYPDAIDGWLDHLERSLADPGSTGL